MRNSNEKQIGLTLIMVASIVCGFFAVSYVANAYQTENTEIILFQTDAETEFVDIPFENTIPYSVATTYKSSQQITISTTEWMQDNLTLVYMGNNTYASNVESVSTPFIENFIIVSIDMPELPNWIVSRVTINSTSHGNPVTDFDMRFNNFENPYQAQITNPLFQDNSGITGIFHENINDLENFYFDIDVPLIYGLEILEKSQEKTLHSLDFLIVDADNIGNSAFVLEFSITVYGEQVAGWTIQNSLIAVLGGASFLNIIVGVYATDGVDIGGYVKTIKTKRRK